MKLALTPANFTPVPGVTRFRFVPLMVMVSPTLAAFSSLMPAMTKPTSPADNFSRCSDLGVNMPTCSHKKVALLAISNILSFGFNTPSTKRTSITTPT